MIAGCEVRYIPLRDPLDPKLKPLVSQVGPLEYSATCDNEKIKIFCQAEDINLIHGLENVIKNKLANAVWVEMLKESKVPSSSPVDFW